MSLSKSQIQSKLKASGLQSYPLDTTIFYVLTTNRVKTLRQIYALFLPDGAKAIVTSPLSATGAVQVGTYTIVVTRPNYAPLMPTGVAATNASVANRMKFGAMINDVISNTLKPIDIVFDSGKKALYKGVTSIRFLGEGVADFTLLSGGRPAPVSVLTRAGSYRINITGNRFLDLAYDALERAAEEGNIDADMTGDTMSLNAPVVFCADIRCVRELIFQDMRGGGGGVGIVGDFISTDYKYDGRTNTLTIKCHRVFQTSTDLKSDDKPYFAIVNNPSGKIGELKGLGLELIPKRMIPRTATIVNI